MTTGHVLAETSSLLRQIGNPARTRIQETFCAFVRGCREEPATSADSCVRDEFLPLGLTDTTVLGVCEAATAPDRIELLTTDEPVYARALALGLPAELDA